MFKVGDVHNERFHSMCCCMNSGRPNQPNLSSSVEMQPFSQTRLLVPEMLTFFLNQCDVLPAAE